MSLQRRTLGIDYGSVRIGVAVSDPLNLIARGLEVVPRDAHAIERLREISQEYDVGVIVVGMPYTLKGEEGRKAQEVGRFVEELRAAVTADVVTIDERFTSVMAQESILQSGVRKKARREKGLVDRTAAALILQDYLDGIRSAP